MRTSPALAQPPSKLASRSEPVVIPNTSLVLISGYDLSNGTNNTLRRRLAACFGDALRAAWASILERERNVSVLSIEDVPEAESYERQWKKLAGIEAAARTSGAELVLWHDGDAFPAPDGELVARVRLLAHVQPHIDCWFGIGDIERLWQTWFTSDDDFWGVSLEAIRRWAHGRVLRSISLHTGYILLRARSAHLVTDVLQLYYDAEAARAGPSPLIRHMKDTRGLPEKFCGGGEQGAVNWHVLSRHAGRVGVVSWIGRDAYQFDCQAEGSYMYPVRVPSLIHFSGCNALPSRTADCLRHYCNTSSPSSWYGAYLALGVPGAPLQLRLQKPVWNATVAAQLGASAEQAAAGTAAPGAPFWIRQSDVSTITNMPLVRDIANLTNEQLELRRRALRARISLGQPTWQCARRQSWDRGMKRCSCKWLLPRYQALEAHSPVR